MARAMIKAGDPWVQKGIRLLHSLEKEFYSRVTALEESGRELHRIESALMAAYRAIGDEEQAKSYAAKILGRAIVNRAVGKF
jgi:hypothetical protein